jgi:hypothetical protein
MRRLSNGLCALAFGATVLGGCERVVSVSLPTGDQRLVVDARFEYSSDSSVRAQTVTLTMTDAYFSAVAPPPAVGATVEVLDDDGVLTVLVEKDGRPGIFGTSAIRLRPSHAYTLRIRWRGDVYEATDRLPSPVPIGALSFLPSLEGPRTSAPLRATVALRDPTGVANFYLWEQFIDGRATRSEDSLYASRPILSDELIDGFVAMDVQPYAGIAVRSGQHVRIRQHAISRQAYLFFTALNEQGANDGSPFGVPSSSLRGNVANRTRPAAIALGFFATTAVTEAEARVP